jgi:multisubunit Na+/H+ antiporter MnhG subunit
VTKKPESGEMSGWWLAVIGAVFLVVGVTLFVLDSAGIIDAHSRPKFVFVSVTLGVILLVMGMVMGIKGERVTGDRRNR